MGKITKKEQRLARALSACDNQLGGDIAMDRAHIYWHEKLPQARELIRAENFLKWHEDYGRPLHASVDAAKKSLEVYNDNFGGGIDAHEGAFECVMLHEEDADEE